MEFARERVADPARGAAAGSLAEGGGRGGGGNGEVPGDEDGFAGVGHVGEGRVERGVSGIIEKTRTGAKRVPRPYIRRWTTPTRFLSGADRPGV